MEETVPTIHTAMVRRNIPNAKKTSGRRFVAFALQQNGDGTMTKTAPEQPARPFCRIYSGVIRPRFAGTNHRARFRARRHVPMSRVGTIYT